MSVIPCRENDKRCRKRNHEIWKKLRKDKSGTCRKGFVGRLMPAANEMMPLLYTYRLKGIAITGPVSAIFCMRLGSAVHTFHFSIVVSGSMFI